MQKYIIISGNPVDGLTFFGPFDEGEDANEWADNNLMGQEWWAVGLHHPDSIDNPEVT